MGNCGSTKSNISKNVSPKKNECFICWEKMKKDQNHITCIHCNIILHIKCEDVYTSKKGYSKCPHCTKIGSLKLCKNKSKREGVILLTKNKKKVQDFDQYQNVLLTS
jgi:hypothetical protein